MGKHNNEPEMTRLEDFRLQRELKELVLEYVSTIFTPTYPTTHGFTLLVCRLTGTTLTRRARGGREEFIVIRAIMYTALDKSTWKIVAESSKAQFGILSALQDFSKDLEREMGRMSGGEKRKSVREDGGRENKKKQHRESRGMFGESDGEYRDEGWY